MSKKIRSVAVGTLLVISMIAGAAAQIQTDFSRVQDAPFTSPVNPKYDRVQPLSIHAQPDFLNHTGQSMSAIAGARVAPLSVANVISVQNFQGAFQSRGFKWPFTMMGMILAQVVPQEYPPAL